MLSKLKNIGRQKTVNDIQPAYDLRSANIETKMYNIPVHPAALTGKGTIWAVQGPQSGVGSTTLAVNIAAYLAQKNPKSVALVDLNGMGAVRSHMGLPVSQCIVNILDWQDIETESDMQQAIVEHSSGIMVIPGLVHYDHVSLVMPDFIFKLLSILKKRYNHIVLDCAPIGPELITWAAVLVSDVVVNVISPHRTCLDIARDNTSFLRRLGCQDRVFSIINQADIPGGIKVDDIKNNPEVGVEVDHILPFSERVIEANNRRELIVNEKPKDAFSEQLRKFVKYIYITG